MQKKIWISKKGDKLAKIGREKHKRGRERQNVDGNSKEETEIQKIHRLTKMRKEKLNGGRKRKKGDGNSKEEMEIQKGRQIWKNSNGKAKRET